MKFKPGDKVFSIQLGVVELEARKEGDTDTWPIQCETEFFECIYTRDGKEHPKEAAPSLYHLDEAEKMGLYKKPREPHEFWLNTYKDDDDDEEWFEQNRYSSYEEARKVGLTGENYLRTSKFREVLDE